MVKVNLPFGKNKKGGQIESNTIASTTPLPEPPKLTLDPITIDPEITKPQSPEPMNSGNGKGLMDEILSTLISTSVRTGTYNLF